MAHERDDVIERFARHFGEWTDRRIALYGVGGNTGHIVNNFTDHTFVGLLDPVEIGETRFGLPVLDLDEAIHRGADAVIIIARPASVNIIYRRIADASQRAHLPVFDLTGQDLGRRAQTTFTMPTFPGLNEARRAIDAADAVSFDVFDTLLTRYTLEPTDVFDLVAERASVQLPPEAYKRARILAERVACSARPAGLADIYAELASSNEWPSELCTHLQDVELQIESEVLIARPGMIQLAQYAINAGKTVTLISDMYLPSAYIAAILNRHGLKDVHVLVSGEEGMAKSTGLMQKYRDTTPGRLLHIGDSLDADVASARAAGIEALHIPSPLAIAEQSPIAPLLDTATDPRERLQIGMLVARLFADPFDDSLKAPLTITDGRTLGYALLAPMVDQFLHWLAMNDEPDQHLLLAARDGHLLHRALTEVDDVPGRPDLDITRCHYFLTSRTASQQACLRTVKDIRELANHAFSGNSNEMLNVRFGLPPEHILERLPDETADQHLLRHAPQIISRSSDSARRYLTYLSILFPKEVPPNLAVVDFVATGSCQLGLEELIGQTTHGKYFIRVLSEDPRRTVLDIQSLHAQGSVYSSQTHLFTLYTFLEAFFSAPHPTITGFSEDGSPEYAEDRRRPAQIALMTDSHEGTLEYLRTLWSLTSPPRSPESGAVPDEILGLLTNSRLNLSAKILTGTELMDDFCNRPYSWSDVL